ncbi:neprilysin-1-like [Pecten maximus]|uniref:neprilysin-1-like n=1 Tax=Pecten maximus TaxID=6579 RepID=UPI00145833E4|nr:neprilysin-1-like [Pecten maximus]
MSVTYTFNNNHNDLNNGPTTTQNGGMDYYRGSAKPRAGSYGNRGQAKPQTTSSCEKVDLTVHIAGHSNCAKPWTAREKYLGTICLLLFVAAVSFVVIALIRDERCSRTTGNVPIPRNYCLSQHCVRTAAMLLEAMDQSVDPCEDFFQYACGNWNRKNIIPDDKSSFNTFEKLHDDLQITLKGLLEEPVSSEDSQATKKVKVLYKSCINVSTIEEVGDRPLRRVLEHLGRWPVVDDLWSAEDFHLEEVLAKMRGIYNAPILIDCWVGADDKNSSLNIIQLDQPVLGMPSREYYLTDQSSGYKAAYLEYMIRFAELLGASPVRAREDMINVLMFETKLANVTKPQSERHDTGALYSKITIKALQRRVPKFDWMGYFRVFVEDPFDESEPIVTFATDYLSVLTDLIEVTDKRVLSNYILWRVIMGFAPEMTENYQQARRAYRRVLQGITMDKPRWQKCVGYVNDRLGMAVGAVFIRDNFRKESKESALTMIHNIREAFNELLEENEWMDDDTRAVARQKANAMNERIGYPDFLTEPDKLDTKYDILHFQEDQYFENILNVELYDARMTMTKLRELVDKNAWDQGPAMVNAFYNPNTNDIVFPAGILQPLFYSDKFPKSLNYGGVGVVIGHEITHGFDDKGRQYDKDGNMKQWWKNETIEAFRKQAQCVIDQYSSYTLEQIGLHIDGKNTQGENIADNGGLKQSYRAYKKWVAKHGEELALPSLELTHDQLFFLNYGQIWCGSMRNEEALHEIRTSVHSPGSIRVLGPLSNSKDFSEAYKCKLGSRMNPTHKCSIW